MPKRSSEPIGTYTHCNDVRLIKGGQDYFHTLIDLIDHASQLVHLQIYIFDDDETGKPVQEALIRASQRGVKVYLVIDGYASSLPSSFVKELIDAGVHFRWFEPLLKGRYFYFGRRLHHKVFVADGTKALVGGLNISNRYNDLPEQPAWLDFAVLIEGEAAYELCNICNDVWHQARWSFKKENRLSAPPAGKYNFDECLVRIRRNDWVRMKNQITRSYIEMLRNSNEEVIIMSSYFLPGRLLQRNLKRAARRGVKIKVVVAGVSDVVIAKQAEKYMYSWLLRHKIRLFEYKKVVLHAKIAVADRNFATVGSYNVNNISTYASVELNIDVHNLPFAETVHNTLSKIITEDCEEVTTETFTQRNGLLHRFIQWCAYQMVRILFYLFTFYFKQQR